ncbi:hypothetical protein QH494_23400 [Sphingomonas sp. AR_OL41]|uniref:hypothetical protein n=1 Tax=Sphingomonas sp. AR_OL41 TaxID=3042729 RepID=UPI00248176E6|nr:hypothetical protein [Sphingomonas sp. AR_OL41]MDH7975142.1 hypothetical protein [Sphingomonas sp. AR_OL41]
MILPYHEGMQQDSSLITGRRPEPDLPGRWGIYSVQHDKWIDVVFASEREALEALKVLKPRPA